MTLARDVFHRILSAAVLREVGPPAHPDRQARGRPRGDYRLHVEHGKR